MNFKPPSFFMRATESVVAQRDLRRKAAFAFSNYTLYLDDPTVGKPTLFVVGPSGAGKTFTIELCCSASGLPFTVIGAGGASASGYKGLTLRDLLAQHYMFNRTDYGVIFIDEIDKKMRGAMRTTDGEQLAMGTNFQSEMLRYVEREAVFLQDEAKDISALRERDPDADEDADPDVAWVPVKFETSRSMWCMAGAFEGLHRLVARRLQQDTIMDESQLWEKFAPADLRAYGMLPELVNRCDVQAYVKPLKGHEIIEIMEAQEKPRLHKLFNAIGCDLDLDIGALARASHLAVQERTGARGAVLRLRQVVSDCYTEADENQLSRCRIDAQVVDTGHLDLTNQPQRPVSLNVVHGAARNGVAPSLAPLAPLGAVAAV